MHLSVLTKPANTADIAREIISAGGAGRRAVKRVIVVGAMNIKNDYQRAIAKGPATGKWYRNRGKGRPDHRASKAGEAPASDTGRLLSSIVFRAKKLQAEAGSVVDYAEALEYGARPAVLGGSSRSGGVRIAMGEGIAPRPALGPAVDKHRPKIRTAIIKRLREVTR
jgi:hypothetical protein